MIFENVKIGDKVTILDRDNLKPVKIRTVDKILKNWFVVDGYKFSFDGWEKRTGNWTRLCRCKHWEQSDTDTIRKSNKKYKLNGLFLEHLHKLSEKDIDRLQEVLDTSDALAELLEGL